MLCKRLHGKMSLGKSLFSFHTIANYKIIFTKNFMLKFFEKFCRNFSGNLKDNSSFKQRKPPFNSLIHVPYRKQHAKLKLFSRLRKFHAQYSKAAFTSAETSTDPLHMTSHWVSGGQMYKCIIFFIDFNEMFTY